MLEVVVRDGQMGASTNGADWSIVRSGWRLFNAPARMLVPFVLVDENDPIIPVPGTGVESPHWGTPVGRLGPDAKAEGEPSPQVAGAEGAMQYRQWVKDRYAVRERLIKYPLSSEFHSYLIEDGNVCGRTVDLGDFFWRPVDFVRLATGVNCLAVIDFLFSDRVRMPDGWLDPKSAQNYYVRDNMVAAAPKGLDPYLYIWTFEGFVKRISGRPCAIVERKQAEAEARCGGGPAPLQVVSGLRRLVSCPDPVVSMVEFSGRLYVATTSGVFVKRLDEDTFDELAFRVLENPETEDGKKDA